MRPVLISCAIIALASCQKPSQPAASQNAASRQEAPAKELDRSHKGSAAPKVSFNDPDGNAPSLEAFSGKPTLVNLWASWCAPCVKELPTLDKLAQAEGGRLNVVAISQDMGPHSSVGAFLQGHKIVALKSYQDPKMALSGALGAEVLPTSVLYDSAGREVWRFVGDRDWTRPEVARQLAEGAAAKGS
jgi:thiol-disulfide isomerase/thioredoxin